MLALPQVEQTLLTVLRTFLDDDEIGPEDNFYARGGDSIVALRVIAAAKDHGVEIELRDLLLQPTVGDLAEAIVRAATQPAPDPALPPLTEPAALIEPAARTGDAAAGPPAAVPPGAAEVRPASALQTGLLYLCELAEDPGLYHDFVGVRVRAEFDEPRFRAALRGLLRRHPGLRSSFDLTGYDVATQIVWSTVEDPLTVVVADTEERADALVADWRAARLAAGIDWSAPPLCQVQVVRLPAAFRLTIGIHHAIIDGWSYARLLVDLLTGYDAALRDLPAELPEVPAGGQRAFLALERAAVADPAAAWFWRTEADVPPLLFDRPRFAAAADPSELVTLPVPDARAAALRSAANRFGVPLKSLLLAVHGWALGRWTGRAADVVTGLVTNGRPELAGADLLVGLFLNTVPLRLRAVSGPLGELARQALVAEQRALPHRRYPLAQIESALGRPAFDVSFNFTHFHVYRELAGLRRVAVDGWWAFDKASFPLLVNYVVDAPGFGTGLQVAFDPALLPAARVDELIALFDTGFDRAVRPA